MGYTTEHGGIEYQQFLCLVQDTFLTQHVLEQTRATRVVYIVLSSQKEFVDNVILEELLGSSDHNQLHFKEEPKLSIAHLCMCYYRCTIYVFTIIVK